LFLFCPWFEVGANYLNIVFISALMK